jgi:phage terminase large subunit GpA-like protein
MFKTSSEGLQAIEDANAMGRKLWAPPADIGISEWAEKNRILPASSGRPGFWRDDPIQREIQAEMCADDVREVVFQKSTRLGWSELCNNAMGWGIDVHGASILMLQPSRDTAEKYSKERLEEMIDRTPILRDTLIQPTSKQTGSTVRFKRFQSGASFFVASAGNPRELRSTRARIIIEDEVDAYAGDVADEGDPDKIVRRRADEFWDARIYIGSTPAMPSGFSRIETAYQRSSQGIYLCPCPHCNAMEPFRWRDPENSGRYLLIYEKDQHHQVIPDSVRWTCVRCGAAIEERWKVPMMESGHWEHARPDLRRVRGFFANGLYATIHEHWAKMAQEWVDAQGKPIELKSFINLNLGETYEERGESVEPSFLRARANTIQASRGIVPDGVAVLVVTVDVQTAGIGRLEAQVVGYDPEERASLVDWQVFVGDPHQADVWDDLDAWLLAGWTHEKGVKMQAHLVLVDSSDGGTQDSVYGFCLPRATRWVFPLKGQENITAQGFAVESGTRKNTIRLFNVATSDLKRNLFSRLSTDLTAPKSISIPGWVTDEYLDQITAEKRVPVLDPKTRVTRYRWMKRRDRNEALDLWVYSLAGLWIITKILAPGIDLVSLAAQASAAHGVMTYAGGIGRRIRSSGMR